MNCTRCGSELPSGGAYCPVCGARRSEIGRFATEVLSAAEKAVGASVAALDRGSKEMQQTLERIANALQPAVTEIDKAIQPLADSTVRAANEVANAFRPAAEGTARAARNVADKTVAAIRPAFAVLAEKTHAAVDRVREATRKRG